MTLNVCELKTELTEAYAALSELVEAVEELIEELVDKGNLTPQAKRLAASAGAADYVLQIGLRGPVRR